LQIAFYLNLLNSHLRLINFNMRRRQADYENLPIY